MYLKFVIDKKYDLKMASRIFGVDKRKLEKKYKRVGKYLNKTKISYQKSWDEINDEFFRRVKEITGYPWKHKIYYCVVSPIHRGISNWGGNKIIRGWDENPYTMRKITAHELLISHIFTIFKEEFKEEKLTSTQKWALAEISAFAICGLEKKMLKFWPWISEKEKYPLNHNYPKLYDVQKILKSKYEKKKSFKEFLKKGIEIVKKMI
jgi:hypothetical protein